MNFRNGRRVKDSFYKALDYVFPGFDYVGKDIGEREREDKRFFKTLGFIYTPLFVVLFTVGMLTEPDYTLNNQRSNESALVDTVNTSSKNFTSGLPVLE